MNNIHKNCNCNKCIKKKLLKDFKTLIKSKNKKISIVEPGITKNSNKKIIVIISK